MTLKAVWRTTLTQTSSSDLEGVGSLRFENGKWYRYVQNTAGTAVTRGQAVCHDLSEDSDLLETVIDPATADFGFLAGLVVASSLADDYYGWILVQGTMTDADVYQYTQTTTAAAGDYLKATNGQNYLIPDASTQPLYNRNVQVLEAVTTSTTAGAYDHKVHVNCL